MSNDSTGRPLKIAAVLIVLIIAIVLLMTPSIQNWIANDFFSSFQEKVPKFAVFKVQRDLKVDANSGTIYNLTLDIPRPTDIGGPSYDLQFVRNLTYSPAPASTSMKYGGYWYEWQHGELQFSETYQASITYDVRVDTHFWDIDEEGSANISEIPPTLQAYYLHDQWKIIVVDEGIEDVASYIVGTEKNVYLILSHINDWITANIAYPSQPKVADPSSSVETLSSRVGDCDDQAILFCALARAVGVPAWLQFGALYDSSDKSWGGHGWVQSYIPLKSGGGEYVPIDTVNRDFLVWKPDRFVEYTDDGNANHLIDYYHTFTYTYDRDSYPIGERPIYIDEYKPISYEPSAEKVKVRSSLFPNIGLEGQVTIEVGISRYVTP